MHEGHSRLDSALQTRDTDTISVRHQPIPRLRRAASLRELQGAASRCRTPKQFQALLERMRTVIPYQKMVAAWGCHKRTRLHYVFNYGFSREFLRWYLSRGPLWRSPVFHEWRRTRRVVSVCEVVKRYPARFDGELLKQYERAGVYETLCGGRARRGHFVYVCLAMASSRKVQAYRARFETVVPWLVAASQRAYPRTLLTKREAAVLERRAMGEITKQIAVAEGISERTVREHLQQIKSKLYTDDLVNAVVIAVRSGMVLQSGAPASRTADRRTAARANAV